MPLFIVNLFRVIYIVLRPPVVKQKNKIVRFCRKKNWLFINKKSQGTQIGDYVSKWKAYEKQVAMFGIPKPHPVANNLLQRAPEDGLIGNVISHEEKKIAVDNFLFKRKMQRAP